MTRRTTARAVWLTLGGLLLTTGARVVATERPFVWLVIAVACFGGTVAMLLPAGVAVVNDPKAAEALNDLRKELTR